MDALYLDYDSTITKASSIPLQLAAIVKALGKAHPADGDVQGKRSEDISRVSADFQLAYDDVIDRCLGTKAAGSFNWNAVEALNEEMAPFEKKWNKIVEDSGILQGAREEDFLENAQQTEIYRDCLEVVAECIKHGVFIRILSVNWSEQWINRSLTDQSSQIRMAMDHKDALIQVHANELEYRDGISTGQLVKRVECGEDKGKLMRSLLEKNSKPTGLSVFVGDSLLDLEPLLLADVGIVLGNDRTLISFLAQTKVKVEAVSTTQLKTVKARLHKQQEPKKSPFLLQAQNWTEIGRFLFDNAPTAPRVLVVAGSDSGGGAGIQADLKTCFATGSFGTTAITAITSQNTFGVQSVHPVPIPHIENQMDSVLSDIGTDVVKIGMLPSAEVVNSVANKLRGYKVPVVVDPVMVSTSGHALTSNKVAEAIVRDLIPLATVVCPNIPEAEVLTGLEIGSLHEMKKAAKVINRLGSQVVLIKGGHLEKSARVQDVVYDGADVHVLDHARVETNKLHGTGCTVASAIASYLAQGWTPLEAIRYAIFYIEAALKSSSGMDVGQGIQLPFDHGYRWHQWPSRPCYRTRFDLTLYGITDQRYNQKHDRSFAQAVRDAISGGITLLQVREKEGDSRLFMDSVATAMEEAKSHGIPVIVNDRVDVALATDADGVHLGQARLAPSAFRVIESFVRAGRFAYR